MATQIDTQSTWNQVLNRITTSLKSHLVEQGKQQDQDLLDEVRKISRKQMAKQLRDQRMSQAMYSYLKVT